LAAGNAASAKNSQPWKVEVLTGAARRELERRLLEKFDAGETEPADYVYTPSPESDEFKARARQVGYALFAWKGIDRRDLEARKAHDRDNYRFFGAPVVLLFHLPVPSERGTFLDMGQFLQNVMLGLLAHGVASCPQASLRRFTQTIKATVGIGDDRILVCGLSVGYADPDAKVNAFVPPRMELGEYVRFHE
jgi:nitroreductase